jgi:cob(I)alamin adenosyltransferase
LKLKHGLIQIYTGEGKGKTTSAIGQGIRAAGNDLSVYMVQFLKSGDTGELSILNSIDNFRVERPRGFFWTLNDSEKLELQEDIDKAISFISSVIESAECDILILDEVMGAISNGLIDPNAIRSLLESKPCDMEIVMTGRNAPEILIEIADYVSVITPLKHPFEKGIPARKGIEY